MKTPLAGLLHPLAGTICLCLLGACGSGSGSAASRNPDDGQTTEPSPDQDPPAAEFVVRGEVFAIDTGMIAEADVDIWVQTSGMGYSYVWANGPLHSDGLGQFEADVPPSEIDVLAHKDGFVQPCGVRQAVAEDVEVRVEMLSVASLNSAIPPLPQLSSEPSVTGFIYESTPNGRKAVTGASLWAGDSMGIGYATTRSDLNGNFYMCRLPAQSEIAISKRGYMTQWVGPFDPSQPTVLEIALVREDYR
jgi:hypothetical protein